MIDWEKKQLGDLGKIVTGKTPPSSETTFYGGSIPFVTPSDMDGRRTIDSTSRYLSSAGAAKVKSSFIQTPAVCVSCIGSDMGKAVLVDQPFVSNQQINSVIVNNDIERLFVYYNLAGRKDEIRFKASGAAQPIMNKSDFGKLTLSVPDQPTQKAIAFVLGALDDKIELNRRMNETLEEMARALFRDWFVDFGPTRRQMEGATDPAAIMGQAFPTEKATTLAPLFPAKLGDDGLPEGWETRVLHDLTDWINGAAYKNMHFSNEPDALPVIKIAELKAGVTKTTKHTNTALGDKYRIKNGEVLFSWSGNPDTSIDTFIWSGGDAWLNQHIFAVRPNGEVDQSVLYFLLKYLRPQFAEIARDKQTTGLGHVTKQDLKGMRVCLGSDKVESAATEIFSPMFAKLYANQQENQTLAALRNLLLPKLMSGEIRLKDAEALV